MASYKKHEAQDWAWETLKGQWTTLITPFTPDNQVDIDGVKRNVRHVRSLGTTGAGCTWNMGEFWALSYDERISVMDAVAEAAEGTWPIGAHVTNTNANEMISLAHHAEDKGFDLLIVAPPYMATKTEDQVIEYVRLLADNTNLAIMFYNSPQFGIVMSPYGMGQLCAIPNVVGIKEASFNQQISIETHLSLGKDYVISTPDEWIYFKGQELGIEQQVMFANTSDWRFDVPGANNYVQWIDRACKGDLDETFYDNKLRRLKELSDTWWTRIQTKYNGALPVAMAKHWGALMGMSAGSVRPPLFDLTPVEKSELRKELEPLKPKPEPKIPAVPAPSRGAWLDGNNNFASGMLLMVSVQNVAEAMEAEQGGADIVDVKNLQEALVGSGHPNIVKAVRSMMPVEKHVSVTLGVVPNQPGTVAMAVYAAAMMDATSVKVGFQEAQYDQAVQVLKESRMALEGFNTKLVGSVFADNVLFEKGLDPLCMVQLAHDGECDGFLIDTLTKDGRNIFDFMPEDVLKGIVLKGKELGMSTALSGHLKLTDLDELARINPDIVGVRGAVCGNGERDRAVAWEAVAEFKRQVDLRKSGEVDVFDGEVVPVTGSSGWVVIDGRGKSCAGVIAALSKQLEMDKESFVEAILADALNIYDVTLWAEQAGHEVLTKRTDPDGTTRVLIRP
ncbi:MAG: dihydrodipicolinate synthase family protein, partial [Chloroflexi bacterium]|nr:dihydrodipicolinate synthase family protein [Chloroflexota bacterium]